MRVVVNESEFDATPENSVIITCQNDMFNGMFIDYPDNYAFIPADADGYPELAFTAVYNKIPLVDIQNPDLEAVPFKWIVNTLATLTVAAAQDLLD